MAMNHEIDFASETWGALTQHIERRINELRVRNDGSLTVEQTASLRGQIAALKNLLTLDKPAPAISANELHSPFANVATEC